MYIERKLIKPVEAHFFRHKAIIVSGARQVGKSTLMRHVTQNSDLPTLYLNCDDPEVRSVLTVFEMKWNPAKSSVKFPQSFIDSYKPRETHVVTPENYLEFLL